MTPVDPVEPCHVAPLFAEQRLQRFPLFDHQAVPFDRRIARIGNLAGSRMLLGRFSSLGRNEKALRCNQRSNNGSEKQQQDLGSN